MKLALLSYSTKPRGGVVHTLALAEALAELGQDVTVWTLGRGGDTGFYREVDPAVRLEVVPFSDVPGEDVGSRVLRSIEVLGAAFRPDAYDVVHAQDCISANAVGKCVRTVHHLDHFSTPDLLACHEKALVTPCAHICVSGAVATELAEGWGIEATVIPNGVAADRFASAAGPEAQPARRRWRERFGRYVLHVGGIEPRKGSRELLESFALLRAAEPDVSLVIAGGETLFDYRDYRADWERRAAELGVAPLVLGPIPDPELPSLVAAADVFAFPSTKEGFGLAPMEALAAGVPLVASDLPVLREVYDSLGRFAATTEDFAEALRAALVEEDPERRAAGQQLARGYTWRAAAERHLEFYRALSPFA